MTDEKKKTDLATLEKDLAFWEGENEKFEQCLKQTRADVAEIESQIPSADETQREDLIKQRRQLRETLDMLPGQIGEATRRQVFIHIQVMKAQADAIREDLGKIQSEFDKISAQMNEICFDIRQTSTNERYKKISTEEAAESRRDTSQRLNQVKPDFRFWSTKLTQTQLQLLVRYIRAQAKYGIDLDKSEEARQARAEKSFQPRVSVTCNPDIGTWRAAAHKAGEAAKERAYREIHSVYRTKLH